MWPSLRHCLTLGCQKRLLPINRTISTLEAVQFQVSPILPLRKYSHIYLSFIDVSWPMMHCARRLVQSGIRLLCGRQQQLLSAASHIINSSLPDVVIPSTAVPDYVWKRVDQWPDTVAIVSIHRASKDMRVTPGSCRLVQCTQCQRSQVQGRPIYFFIYLNINCSLFLVQTHTHTPGYKNYAIVPISHWKEICRL